MMTSRSFYKANGLISGRFVPVFPLLSLSLSLSLSFSLKKKMISICFVGVNVVTAEDQRGTESEKRLIFYLFFFLLIFYSPLFLFFFDLIIFIFYCRGLW